MIPLAIKIGADLRVLLEVRSLGAVVDVTDAAFVAKLRPALGSAVVAATLTVEVVDGPAGRIAVSLPAATTTDLIPGAGVWDLTMTLDGLVVQVVTDGRYTIALRAAR